MTRGGVYDVMELVQSLRQEQLFVSSEKRKIHQLNEEVRKYSDRLFEKAWQARHQRINLDCYILNLHDIQTSHRKDAQLDAVHFIDSFRRLGNADTSMCELLKALRDNPKLLALFLDRAEHLKVGPSVMQHLINSVMISLYGACILPEDNNLALVLLYELMHLQLPRSNELRRLLQNGNCTFSRCYKAFVEAHIPAKLFLTSALRNAIIQVLVHDDLYLDFEPNNTVIRFSPEERLRHFGEEGTPQYEASLKSYRTRMLRKLTMFANVFLEGIKESIFCFPPALAWLVRQFYSIILEENKLESRQIAVICADLVFYFFICPAIVNPELFGIIEEGFYIGQIARYNLMQIARIVQVLAMARYEPIDERLEEVYRNFDKDLLPNILEDIIQGSQQPELFNDILNSTCPATDQTSTSQSNGPLTRNAVLISPSELQDLVTTLHKVRGNEMQGSLLKEWLMPLMQHVPEQMPSLTPTTTNGQTSEDASLKKAIRSKVNKIRNTGHRSSSGFDSSSVETVDEASSKDLKHEVITEVLVMPLPTTARREFPGGLTEDTVLSMEQSKRSATRVRLNLDNLDEKSSTGSGKRAKFFGDQESIAGASDNLEAVSEAASMASSLDLEENAENDNLSDMVSANVSGPGTPSVSGRDTPSSHGAAPVPPNPSQIAEQLQLLQGNPPQAPQVHVPPPSNIPTRRRAPPRQEAQKQMDMEDRFGRFGLGKSTGAGSSITEEETKSMVSDTWSTDVLGSDCEAYNAQEQQQNLEAHLNALQQHIHGHLSQQNVQQLIDLSETQSDAWSTAAMTSYSDLDRLQEVENQEEDMIMGSDRGQNGEEAVPEFVGARAPVDRQSTPTNLIKLDSGEDNLIDISSGGVAPPVGSAPPSLQPGDIISGAFAHSLSNGSVVSFAGSFTGDSGSQSLGRLSFAMKEQSLSGENILDGDIVMMSNGAAESSNLKPQGSAESSDGNSESSSDYFGLGTSAESEAERQNQMKTGAIPKTPRINLQQSASRDRGGVPIPNSRHNRSGGPQRGFFRKIGTIKQSISSKVRTLDARTSGGFRRSLSQQDFEDPELAVATQHAPIQVSAPPPSSVQFMDPSEILEKYRGKSREEPQVADSASSVSGDLLDLDESEASSQCPEEVMFLDAKRKLRTVFSTANVHVLNIDRSSIDLILLLRMMLAESIGLQNHQLTAQLHEAIRCISKLNSSMQKRVIHTMREDYRQRSVYISYLVRSRQGLEATLATLQTHLAHVKKDKSVTHGYLTTFCVQEFLQILHRKEHRLGLETLLATFGSLTVSDEKADLVERYLEKIFKEMASHPLWHSSSDEYLSLSEAILERMIMGKVYMSALFPNGDIDLNRDQVLHAHIRRLAQVVTPQHKALRIPKIYLLECPWPSAQAVIATLNAYKSPRDKMNCVFLCCKTIMDLLHLASNSAAAADDLFPILVYVLIQANPQYLLSNIEYVKQFCPGYQDGEAGYYWTMLDSAVVFIKGLEYN
ncbi:GTPase-activating protein and VPS9 domain-containing protein 1 [Galendromus occidentalis]|uniref:Receptor-mediated endocytosis protein 6 homolog n=1 Tax=Galendromus occidentalis TaxID=34638 RepID=A0AAJ7SEL6_9ACAR|nr:GTPase-activating protein and VPS9 domain-containing protein 1 [Galendromus occidentalis]